MKKALIIIVILVGAAVVVKLTIFDFMSPIVLIGKCDNKGTDYITLKNKYDTEHVKNLADGLGYQSFLMKSSYVDNIDIHTTDGWGISLIGPNPNHSDWELHATNSTCTKPNLFLTLRLRSILKKLEIESDWLRPWDIKTNRSVGSF